MARFNTSQWLDLHGDQGLRRRWYSDIRDMIDEANEDNERVSAADEDIDEDDTDD